MRRMTYRTLLILIIAVGIGGCANQHTPYTDWSKKEQKLYKYQLALQVTDTMQTVRLIQCQETGTCPLAEANPIYGSSPSMQRLIAIKLVGNLLLYRLLTSDDTHRERNLKLANGGYTIIVSNNHIIINKAL